MHAQILTTRAFYHRVKVLSRTAGEVKVSYPRPHGQGKDVKWLLHNEDIPAKELVSFRRYVD